MNYRNYLILSLLLCCASPGHLTAVWAAQPQPMRFDPRPNAQVPLNLVFQNENGSSVRLADLIQQKPVILNLVYFNCPMMCTRVLNGLVTAMRAMPLDAGKDFSVMTVSIDDREKPKLANAKKRVYLDRYARAGDAQGWSFLTGEAAAIKSLADSVGFEYKYYADLDQFDHPMGLVILTPSGKVSKYLYGVKFDSKILQAALVQASN